MTNILELLCVISAFCLFMTVVSATRVLRADPATVSARRRWAIRWTGAAFLAVAATGAAYIAGSP